jgi:hypothetical protein
MYREARPARGGIVDGMPDIERNNLRARSFTVAHHITGEKRPVVFLHVAEAEVERLRQQKHEAARLLHEFALQRGSTDELGPVFSVLNAL